MGLKISEGIEAAPVKAVIYGPESIGKTTLATQLPAPIILDTERGSGRIALVGTAAASHSLPFAAGYAGSKAGLARFADALRLAVAQPLELPDRRGRTFPTLSIGVTLARPHELTAELIERADAAMYLAKRNGRNQVVAIAA